MDTYDVLSWLAVVFALLGAVGAVMAFLQPASTARGQLRRHRTAVAGQAALFAAAAAACGSAVAGDDSGMGVPLGGLLFVLALTSQKGAVRSRHELRRLREQEQGRIDDERKLAEIEQRRREQEADKLAAELGLPLMPRITDQP